MKLTATQLRRIIKEEAFEPVKAKHWDPIYGPATVWVYGKGSKPGWLRIGTKEGAGQREVDASQVKFETGKDSEKFGIPFKDPYAGLGEGSKLTLSQLRRIIKEEVSRVLSEATDPSVQTLADELGAQVLDASSRPGEEEIEAQCTARTFPGGIPVLKNIARAKPEIVRLPPTFKVVDDVENGWWYFKIDGLWCGVSQDIGTPPFDI